MNLAKVPSLGTLSWPIATAIVLNLVPVIGVLFWGWSVFALVFLYWLENVIIGARTLLSMFANAFIVGGATWIAALFIGGFFTLHYGLFCTVHGVFVLAMFGGGTTAAGDGFLDLFGAARALFAEQTNLFIGFLSIIAWQGVQFVLFIARGEARTANPLELMAAPYPRIIVLHLAIIFGGFLIMLMNQPIWGLLILTLMKMAWDVADARKEGRLAAANEA